MSPHTCTETIHWSSDTCKGSLDEGGGEGGGGGADAKPSSTPPRAREPRTKRHRREWGDAAHQGVSRKETSELHAGLVKLGQQLALWMEKLVNAHEKCRAIPSNPVIRLSIFIFT